LLSDVFIIVSESALVFDELRACKSRRERRALVDWHCDTLAGFWDLMRRVRHVFAGVHKPKRPPARLPASMFAIMREYSRAYEVLRDQSATNNEAFEALFILVRLNMTFYAHFSE
jgi:hypothetical protein